MQNAEPPAIVVEGLVKHFRVHHQGNIKMALLGAVKRQSIENFLALDSLSFEIPHGQTVAIIGKNGSGKSTLLSVLARVYRPTSGTVKVMNRQGGPARIARGFLAPRPGRCSD